MIHRSSLGVHYTTGATRSGAALVAAQVKRGEWVQIDGLGTLAIVGPVDFRDYPEPERASLYAAGQAKYAYRLTLTPALASAMRRPAGLSLPALTVNVEADVRLLAQALSSPVEVWTDTLLHTVRP